MPEVIKDLLRMCLIAVVIGALIWIYYAIK